MKEFSIWIEGYAATGNLATASFVGKAVAETFEEAVIKAVGPTLDEDVREPDGYRRRGGKLCTWGCRYFDNEADARASFG